MRVKYNRVSTLAMTGARYELDTEKYDLVLMDKVSGSVSFKDRPKGKVLVELIEDGKVTDVVVEEFSRLGRNTGDVIRVLEWMENYEVNVTVKNIGLQSRPNGQRNPIWKMISSVMSSLYEMELENIKERTAMGRLVYVQRGGVLGRKAGTTTNDHDFMQKPKSKKILEYLKKDRPMREISKICDASTKTVQKVKNISVKLGKL